MTQVFDLATLNGSNGFKTNNSIWSVSDAGDVNGDGYDDIVVGNRSTYYSQYDSSYIIFGKNTPFNATFDLSTLNGNNGFKLIQDHYSLNWTTNAGDFNGDGFDDLLVGGISRSPVEAAIFFGKEAGFASTEHLSTALQDKNTGINIVGVDWGGSNKDRISVSSAGDINGDHIDDIIVSNGANGGQDGYVVFGKNSFASNSINVQTLNGTDGFRLHGIEGANGKDFFGYSLSGAGDVNGDDFDDLMVAGHDREAYVIFGRSDFFSNPEKVIKGTNKSDMLVGTKAAERFEAGNGNDTLIGKGGADIYHAGLGNDYIRIHDLNFNLVDGGEGNGDTLAIAAVDANLDLAKFSGKIMGIEKIYLYGPSGSDSGVTLNANQLKALSDTSNKLIVNGNHGDYVHITDDGWQDKGIYHGFHTYTNADAELVVGINVTVNFI